MLHSGYRKIKFVTAYRPVKKSSAKRRGVLTEGFTVWE